MDRTITVTGRGKLDLVPDMVKVVITLESKHSDYSNAIAASATLIKELQDAVVSIGFKANDLKTASFSVSPYYDNVNEDGMWRNKLMGYEFRSEMLLAFDNDNRRLSDVINAVTAISGEPRIDIRYTLKDQEKAREMLIASAVKDSYNKAKVIASAAGVALGDIVSVDYSWGDKDIYNQPVYLYRGKATCDSAAVSYEVTPEDITIEDNVTITWDINGAIL